MPLLASELYALSQGYECKGPDRCHWCSAPCERKFPHDDLPVLIGVKRTAAKCPGNQWICTGCWLWRRGSISVEWIHKPGKIDRQRPSLHSWLITPERAVALDAPASRERLYEFLLSPPPTFSLSLIGAGKTNYLQFAETNDGPPPNKNSRLAFTLEGTRHEYTPYELEHAIAHGESGRLPGVQALVRLFGRTDPPRPILAPVVGRPKGTPQLPGEKGHNQSK